MSSENLIIPIIQTKGCVLVIESVEENSRLVKKEIESLGVKVLVAKKLTEATVMMQKQKFCSLIISSKIEGSSSQSYILRIRKNLVSENQETPIILIGDKFEKDDFEKLRKVISAAIVIPFKDGALSSNILKFCQQV